MISRRALLRSLLALPIAAVVDVEELIWTPGQQIFVPKYYSVPVSISLDEINAITMKQIMPSALNDFFRTSSLLASFGR